MCTDHDSEIAYLNDLDDQVRNLDVVDDYKSERAEVLRAQGKSFHFSKGDYVVKALLGPFDPYFDNLDARPGGKDGCCTVL